VVNLLKIFIKRAFGKDMTGRGSLKNYLKMKNYHDKT